MVTKQPEFQVDFKELAVLAIQRQQRGKVVMILKDTTADVDKVTYRTLGDVKKAEWTAKNYSLISLAFMGNPYSVTIVKTASDFAEAQPKLAFYDNYILLFPEALSGDFTSIANYLKVQRTKNNYSTAVLGKADGKDAQYIVNFATDKIKALGSDKVEEFTAGEYTARVAGALGGLASSRSLTYYELPDLVDCQLSEDADADVKAGKLVVLHQDGSYKLGRAVNSLTTLTDGITEAFQKIRVAGIMDQIANDIVYTFRTGYVGKYTNNYSNKLRFVGAINAYLHGLAEDGLLEIANQNEVKISYDKNKAYLQAKGVDTSKMSYDDIIQANTGSKVLLDGVCSPTDAMEDLDLGMFLFQEFETVA